MTDHVYLPHETHLTLDNLSLLFDLSPSAVVLLDAQERIIAFNEPVLTLLGYQQEELRYLFVSALFANENDYTRTLHVQAFLEHNQTLQTISAMSEIENVALLNKYQRRIIVNVSINRVINAAGEPNVILYFHDISQLMSVQQALQEANGQLKQTLQHLHESQSMVLHQERLAKVGTMLAGVAHEVNNPVMGVLLNVQYVIKRCTDERSSKALLESEVELKRVGKLVQGLLSFARKHNDKPHPVSLYKIVAEAIKLADLPFKWVAHSIENHVSDDLPDVQASEDSLKQILINLIVNANQAMKEQRDGRIVVDAWVLPNNKEIELRITDNGPGIPDALRERIFEPFFTTKTQNEGTGLGLSLCVTLAHQFGAQLTLDDRYDKGARFSLLLQVDSLSQDKLSLVHKTMLSREILFSLKQSVADDVPLIIESFIATLPAEIDHIQQAFERHDMALLRRAAHSLKSSSISVGALALSHLCLKIEAEAKVGRLNMMADLLKQLSVVVDKTKQALYDYCAYE